MRPLVLWSSRRWDDGGGDLKTETKIGFGFGSSWVVAGQRGSVRRRDKLNPGAAPGFALAGPGACRSPGEPPPGLARHKPTPALDR